MNRKIFTIVLSLALIGCFFLPYYKFMDMGISGYDIVFKETGGNWEKYLWLLIPLSGVFLLIGALNNENYFLGRGLLTWLPLLTIIFMLVRQYMNSKPAISEWVKMFGVGFWATLVVAIVLAFVNPKRN